MASRIGYNSPKRFVRALRVRDPDRFDVFEREPGEESDSICCHVADVLRQALHKVVWKADQQSWVRDLPVGGPPDSPSWETLRPLPEPKATIPMSNSNGGCSIAFSFKHTLRENSRCALST
jgi:hypothetical protein